MRKAVLIMTLLFLLSTVVSTIAGDSTSIPAWDWTGVAINEVSAIPRFTQFTSNGTWTAPAGVTRVWVTICGGGGGGSGGTTGAAGAGAGGGAGESKLRVPSTVTPSTSYNVIVGAAGGGGAAGVCGGVGWSSVFNGITAGAGAGGCTGKNVGNYGGAYVTAYNNQGPSAPGTGGMGYNPSVGTLATPGGNNPVFGTAGGSASSPFGGGGGGGGYLTAGIGGGAAGNGGSAVGMGSCAGGGGGGACATCTGGSGGGGLVIIEW